MVKDHSNPLSVALPYQFQSPDDYPTEILATRFQAWRAIIKDLVNYMREYASVQEEIVRQQIRLQQAVGISAKSIAVNHGSSNGHSGHRDHSSNNNYKEVDVDEINRFFLPIGNGSIQDLPTILTKFHQQNVNNSSKTLKELNNIIIPKLEELRKDLLIKIKEIKNLQNDFKNNLNKELNETKSLLSQYYQSVELSNKLEHGNHHFNDSNDVVKFDPYLIKIKLDRQIKKQLQEENYLFQAYENLQQSGGKLESIIVIEVQNYLTTFLNLLNEEHSTIPNFLLPNLNNGFLSKEPTFEWDSFIAKNIPSPNIGVSALNNSSSNVKNGTFVDLNFGSRKFTDLVINNYNTPLNLAVREGYLERRSKFLKNYSRGWYVLTCNFIHEFKTNDRKKDQIPILSIPLDSCQVSERSKDDGKNNGTYKFILTSKLSNGLMHRNQNWVFRADTYESMKDWYDDIKTLTSLPNPSARSRHVNKKLKLETHLNPNLVSKVSRTSSMLSTGTTKTNNVNTLRTYDTNQSKKSTAQNRLSSTFSSKNPGSPRLNHLINSDGTIITPIESNDMTKPLGTPRSQSTSQYNHMVANNIHQPTPQPQPYILPQSLPPQQPQPQQQNQTQPISMVLPPNMIPNFQQGYYVSNGQVQQFYDPNQQQYFTIQPQQNQGGPQPQYFPTSPQPQPQPQFTSSSPNPQQGYFFVNQMQPSHSHDYSFGGNLPYPTDEAHPQVPPSDVSQVPEIPQVPETQAPQASQAPAPEVQISESQPPETQENSIVPETTVETSETVAEPSEKLEKLEINDKEPQSNGTI